MGTRLNCEMTPQVLLRDVKIWTESHHPYKKRSVNVLVQALFPPMEGGGPNSPGVQVLTHEGEVLTQEGDKVLTHEGVLIHERDRVSRPPANPALGRRERVGDIGCGHLVILMTSDSRRSQLGKSVNWWRSGVGLCGGMKPWGCFRGTGRFVVPFCCAQEEVTLPEMHGDGK